MKKTPSVIIKSEKNAIQLAKNILYNICDGQAVLFLSGGSTPKPLYRQLAKEKKLNVGAVAMVDERFGEKMHKNSNEKMIGETGLLLYLEKKKIPFYPILRLHPKGALDFAKAYDREVKYLLEHFSKRVAIMGIGEDGHTASLRAGVKNSKLKVQNYVTNIDDFPIEPKERITLTFKALSEMDLLIILAFGSAKRNALASMFEKGSLEEIPARLYTQKEVAKKTILITDQKI